MKEYVEAFSQLRKQPPVLLGAVGFFGMVVSLFLALMPDEWSQRVNFAAFRTSSGHWLLIAAAIFFLLLVLAIAAPIAGMMSRAAESREEEEMRKREAREDEERKRKEAAERYGWLEEAFGSLQLMERVYMAVCLLTKSTTLYLPDDDGYAAGLCGRNLLERVDALTCRIPPQVWVYMLNNDERLKAKLLHGLDQTDMKVVAITAEIQGRARHMDDERRKALGQLWNGLVPGSQSKG